MNIKDPVLHSHIEDVLPDDHPLAFSDVFCRECGGMLHADNNECMQTWVETGLWNFCIQCFAKMPNASNLGEFYGILSSEHEEIVDETSLLLATLADVVEYDFAYVGGEANIEDPMSLYNRVKRARSILEAFGR